MIENVIGFIVNKGGGGGGSEWIMKEGVSISVPDQSLPKNVMIIPKIVLVRFHHIGSLEKLKGCVKVVIFVQDGLGYKGFPVCSREVSNRNIDVVEGGSISVRDGGVGGIMAFGIAGFSR